MTTPRLPYNELSPGAYQGFLHSKKALEKSPLGAGLIELINLRVSQINGCAYCTQLHAGLLRQRGLDDAMIDSLAGWRVSDRFTERERAALTWAESLTHVAETAAPDAAYQPLATHFDDTEISDLTFAVALMNAFNRLAVGMPI
ncbi:alkylhydroperoxidase AhpD family core domain protein [Salinisphaera sp. S4-8]|uniref:carboxymuconolactone decarboxylase family protein n=1 Tax=Salinisphaera sp. S4-8 TaxID=633357 RepID=UPI00333EC715